MTKQEKLKKINEEKEARIKTALLAALEKNLGIVSKSCEAVGVNRKTYYRYREKDPVFKEQTDELTEVALDYVEGKMFQKISGVKVKGENGVYTLPPSDTMIIFYLKCKGKARGYIERSELGIRPLGGDNDLPDDELDKELESLRNEQDTQHEEAEEA